jgi:rhamnosyltransferase
LLLTNLARTAAVVVTFQPELKQLESLLESLSGQVQGVFIVDNGSFDGIGLRNFLDRIRDLKFPIECHFLSTNIGLSAAQNLGTESAMKADFTHVIFFDQDSCPSTNMVEVLLAAERELLSAGNKVAALGPCFLDGRQDNPPPFVSVKGLTLVRFKCESESQIHAVDYVIASGCLIQLDVLRLVGLMDPKLFIDYIDIEWGLRAKMFGLQSFGVCAAKMGHELGDEPIMFLGRRFPVHSPLRHYYLVRNAVNLYLRYPVPLNWKIVDAWKLFLKLVFYSLFAEPRYSHCRFMLIGLLHGCLGRSGPLRKDSSLMFK